MSDKDFGSLDISGLNCPPLEKFKMFQDIPQFGAYGVLGTHRDIIVDEVYEIEHINSDRSETHMQHDTLYGDFGYMTSHGYDW